MTYIIFKLILKIIKKNNLKQFLKKITFPKKKLSIRNVVIK